MSRDRVYSADQLLAQIAQVLILTVLSKIQLKLRYLQDLYHRIYKKKEFSKTYLEGKSAALRRLLNFHKT